MKELIQNIQCPQCAGQLVLQGGQQVLSITCQYCGSVLDTRDNFKVLSKFLTKKRPSFPFKLGMKSTWNNVEFILIGIVEYTQLDMWGSYPWIEGLLFSATHGYLWLIFENGHFVIGRESKKRASNEPKKLSQANIFKDTLSLENVNYKIFEVGFASITYVEGELTWVAKAGDKLEYLDAISPPHLYCIEQNESEKEYFTGDYVTVSDVFKAFNVPQTTSPQGVYCCQPFKPSLLLEAISYSGKLYALICLFLILWFASLYSGNNIYNERLPVKPQVTSATGEANEVVQKFSVNKASQLLAFKIYAPLSNAWALFDIAILDAEGNEIFMLYPELSYYSGVEGGESWSEGSRSKTAYFSVPKSGEYGFTVSYEGGTNESDWGIGNMDITVKIDENVKSTRYLFVCFIFMSLFAILKSVSRYRFEKKRWKDYYEDQEDDD